MVKKKRQHDAQEEDMWTDSCEDDAPGASAVSNCQHVKKSVDTSRLRKQLKNSGLLLDCINCIKLSGDTSGGGVDASGFEYDNTLWLCLKCGTQLCGRSRNQHALLHYKTPHSDSHALTMNTRSFEIWCYDCDNEVSANTRKNLLECVEIVKKLAQKPPAVTDGLTSAVAASVEATAAAAAVVADSVINNIEGKIIATLEALSPLVPSIGSEANKVTAPLPTAAAKGIVTSATSNAKSTTLTTNQTTAIPLPPPPSLFPGSAKRFGEVHPAGATSALRPTGLLNGASNASSTGTAAAAERLPRVRGLTNLGNTCFFNAVMQCLAQTPFLLEVLKELAEPGEEFVLPGGTFKFKDKEDVELPMIKGTLSSWGGLTAALAHALEELQSGGAVFTPSRLFDKLCTKCPQFTGGDQHDSHELLRQLLESVRSEDLKRYQRVILQNLGYKDQDINSVSEEMRQQCKIYGNQAADRILRPEQVFRGFLVSTLTCQECYNCSSRHEYFLDMSLPVTVEKPQPPQRRRASPDLDAPVNGINTNFTGGETNIAFSQSSFYLHPTANGPTKAQIKKDKEKERKAKRAAKHQRNKQAQRMGIKLNGANNVDGGGGGDADVTGVSAAETSEAAGAAKVTSTSRDDTYSSSLSTSEQSDADVEDNLVDDNTEVSGKKITNKQFYTDTNGNNQRVTEKRDDTPENMDKDSLEEDENDSGIATSPVHGSGTNAENSSINNNKVNSKGGYKNAAGSNSVLSMGLSEKGVNMVRQLSLGDSSNVVPSGGVGAETSQHATITATTAATNVKVADSSAEKIYNEALSDITKEIKQRTTSAEANNTASTSAAAAAGTSTTTTPSLPPITNGIAATDLSQQLDQMQLQEQQLAEQVRRRNIKRVRTQSYSDWSTTIAPRYQCDDGECSVQSCLNNFTAVELMTGNNKVGCDSCTKLINGDDPKAKTVNTNATKQFLVSSPPAVLILHLKRFQLGPRCIFRKLTRAVNFPMLLDIAPFCGSKVKNLPNIDRKQKKLLYALYGIVEHSGNMYGGHYTAFVKVRPKLTPDDKRWKFLPHGSKAELDQDDDQLKKLEELLAKEKARELRLKTVDDSDDLTCSSTSSVSDESQEQNNDDDNDTDDENFTAGAAAAAPSQKKTDTSPIANEADNIQVPAGKWYYVSDSRVQEVNEDTVLKAQAYLLFYERIY